MQPDRLTLEEIVGDRTELTRTPMNASQVQLHDGVMGNEAWSETMRERVILSDPASFPSTNHEVSKISGEDEDRFSCGYRACAALSIYIQPSHGTVVE